MSAGDQVGFEEHHLTYKSVAEIRKHFPRIKLAVTNHLVALTSMAKSDDEIASLTKAAIMAGDVWEQVLPFIRQGVAEADIAAEIVYRARKCGSETEAFDPIVASGERSALPHAKSSQKILQHGDLVVIDFGCVVDGYHSDMTRTIAIGNPDNDLVKGL